MNPAQEILSKEEYERLLKEGEALALISGDYTAICRVCGSNVAECTFSYNHGLCEACRTKEALSCGTLERQKTSMEERMKKWEDLCPELYRKGDIAFIDQEKFVRVTRWKFGSMGLMLSGSSRTGKTTSCWHLLHKLYILEGKSFYALSEPEFSIQREKSARNFSIDGFLGRCLNCEVFFLDDIGHSATSSKHMEELYYVIEKRTSWKKPILCTTQFTMEEMEQRSSKSGTLKTAIAILNRLKCFCHKIEF